MIETKNYFNLISEQVRNNCINTVKSLPLGYEVVIRKADKKRTNQQNRLMWGPWFETLAAFTGSTKEELHDIFKVRFLGVKKRVVDGVELIEPKSTTELSKEEFSDYMAKIEATALVMGCTLPAPDYYGVDR